MKAIEKTEENKSVLLNNRNEIVKKSAVPNTP